MSHVHVQVSLSPEEVVEIRALKSDAALIKRLIFSNEQ